MYSLKQWCVSPKLVANCLSVVVLLYIPLENDLKFVANLMNNYVICISSYFSIKSIFIAFVPKICFLEASPWKVAAIAVVNWLKIKCPLTVFNLYRLTIEAANIFYCSKYKNNNFHNWWSWLVLIKIMSVMDLYKNNINATKFV